MRRFFIHLQVVWVQSMRLAKVASVISAVWVVWEEDSKEETVDIVPEIKNTTNKHFLIQKIFSTYKQRGKKEDISKNIV